MKNILIMNKIFLPFVLCSCLLSACCEDNGALLWALFPDEPMVGCDSTKATPSAGRFTVAGALYPEYLADSSTVLLAGEKSLYWTDLNTGSIVKEIASPTAAKAFYYPDAIYRAGDLAISASGTRLATINVKTKELVWERTLTECEISGPVTGVGDQYFVVRTITEPDGVTADAVFAGNLRNADRLDLLFEPTYSRENHSWAGYGRIASLAPFVGADGHTYLLTAYYETRLNSAIDDSYLALYDATAQAWVYQRESPAPATGGSTIRNITVTGTTAYLSYQGKILIWEIASGKVLTTIEAALGGSSTQGFWGKMQVSSQYIIANDGNGDLQVFDQQNHAFLYRINLGGHTVRAEFELDLLFVSDADGIDVYQLSTGRKVETILAPCQQLGNSLIVWKDIYGAVHVAVGNGNGRINHYVLQN